MFPALSTLFPRRRERPDTTKVNEIKKAGRKVLGVDDDYTNLYRYAATLRKEDTLDREERAGVEKSVVRRRQQYFTLFFFFFNFHLPCTYIRECTIVYVRVD